MSVKRQKRTHVLFAGNWEFSPALDVAIAHRVSYLSLNEHRKRKSNGALNSLRPEPSTKVGVGLEAA